MIPVQIDDLPQRFRQGFDRAVELAELGQDLRAVRLGALVKPCWKSLNLRAIVGPPKVMPHGIQQHLANQSRDPAQKRRRVSDRLALVILKQPIPTLEQPDVNVLEHVIRLLKRSQFSEITMKPAVNQPPQPNLDATQQFLARGGIALCQTIESQLKVARGVQWDYSGSPKRIKADQN